MGVRHAVGASAPNLQSARCRLAGLPAARGAETWGGKRSGRRAAKDQVRATGSTQRGSSFAGRLTSVLTGWAVMASAG